MTTWSTVGRRNALGALLATVLTSAALAVSAVTAAPARADSTPGCPEGGATVLVDFGDLARDAGQDVRTGCDDAADDDRAAQSVVDAGFELTYATRSAGFVCRVDGLPSDDPCVHAAPPDAYWSVWWAEPGGDWVYSTRGLDTLRTPLDGHLAMVWHSGSGPAEPPSVAPLGLNDGPHASGGRADAVEPTSDDGDSLPAWVVPGVAGVLVGAGALVVRRRRA